MRIHTLALLLGVLLISSALLALAVGHYSLSVHEILQIITSPQGTSSIEPRKATVFWNIRLPRMLAAMLIGAGLAAAGAAYQGMFRNPLVSPDILGVSAGAGVGATFGIFLGLPMLFIQLLAFAGGLGAVTLVCLIARMAKRHDPVLALVLVGMAIGALGGAAIALIKILADPYTQLPSITFWLLGGLSATTVQDLKVAAILIMIGLAPLMLLRWRMNLLSLPDEEARTLGVNIRYTRLLFIFAATLITASAVSIAGIIGWIGLVVPHICRLIVGDNFNRLLPVSIAVGALLLLLTDTLARTLAAIELPLGILTSSIGAPFFLLLLLRGERA
ncbi:iron ABC transporter permease [Pectobacterium parmentieri]|uniref:ABC transporter, permease protein, FecCD family n=1 Tax=Pectobacterium parmentieri TaxID=1905730 RepID=A0A0H3I3K4_PECPM|nr:iron ABC transporter permease [Pectobacterium parmentieri]AFI88390.1 ABC transporter, permease protein, FecCD family [Pectobacterium parmentieri]AOR60602.1 peptide ABC transporter substrate-binding protein [Pectobacterium parmentieri]AYH08465.1 iron ABC transporter permease [Pectobacterium parmentieri]AYH20791.1 iron ABC transporter permease [Pectobacterium parmentieri]AYH34822.1 iron ABC transporter permease [Pectobacterium parmentieri]